MLLCRDRRPRLSAKNIFNPQIKIYCTRLCLYIGRWLAAAVTKDVNLNIRREINPRPTNFKFSNSHAPPSFFFSGDAFHLFREKGGAKKLPTNLISDGHIEKIIFIGWILLVCSDVERRRTLRTAVFLFYLKTDSRGRLSLHT